MSAARPGPWARIVARIAHKEPATPLALFRIAMGLSVLYTLLPMLRDDVVRLVWMDRAYGGFRTLTPHHWLLDAVGGASDASVTVLVGAAVVTGVLLIIGLGGRVTAFAALQLMIALFEINSGSGGGHDRLHTNGLWLLVLAPSTATLSLDCWITSKGILARSDRKDATTRSFLSTRPVAAWPRYVAVFQLVLVYGTTGLQKLGQEWMPWGDFRALYYAILAPSWQRYPTDWVADLYPLTQVGTAVTWLWEVGAPLLLLAFWYRATRDRPGFLRRLSNRIDLRSIYLAIGAFFHISLWLMMNLGPFSLVTMSFYLCAYHHDEYAALWARLTGGRARRSTSADAQPPQAAAD
ncbi:MAG: HTTM domain-containing protein [Alphaproteobacteria bacterium]|nr:HTTM domain-containing protein [Alphaproteobacteria bacterium]